jgi:glutaredoxin 3
MGPSVAAPRVVMYVTGWCPYCARAQSLLEQKGVAVEAIDVEAVPGAREEMMARGGGPTVPQIFVGDRLLGGCDDLYALEAAGALDPILKNGA